MKQLLYFLLPFLIISFLISCDSSGDEDPLDVFREIAYNSLTVAEKSTLMDQDFRAAEVTAWVDGYYLVVFRTTEDATLGPIRVVVDPTRGVVVEKLTRP
ncbi:hypothetical protein Aoki45_03890 [Algoriphagus sp. oki45]|uniref:hypothetical protein n=1 Tax=Algoriphagus sp. oki45 TaxID=3067294 RepID=UPI0027EAD4F6|nr:hypothetical protein Aoki45_03890 [Algoriphagus sp. oki45]